MTEHDAELMARAPEIEAALRFFITVCEEGGNGEGWTLQQAVARGRAALYHKEAP